MKTTYRTLALAAALLTAITACNKEEMQPVSDGNVFIAEAPTTKITLGDDFSLTWNAGDKVSVYDGTNTYVFTADKDGATTSLGNSSITIDPSLNYSAVYPYSESYTFSRDSVTMTIPGEQNFTKTPFGYTFCVANCNGDARRFAFKNLTSLVAFEITETDITKVTIRGRNGENLCGTIKASCKDAGFEYIYGGGVKEIVLTADTVFEPGYYYAAVLPREFTKGMLIDLTKIDGTNTVRTTKAFTLARSSYIDLEKLDQGRTWGRFITNATELQAFLNEAPTLPAETVVKFAGDIDLKGVTLEPATYYEGTLDGCGYSIKNWKTKVPLIGELDQNGKICNIVIDKSGEFEVDKETELEAFLVGANAGEVSNCINNAQVVTHSGIGAFTISKKIGGLVAINTGKIVNCTNNGEVRIYSPAFASDATTAKEQWVGGIVGMTYSDDPTQASVSGCTNNAYMIFHLVRAKAGIFVGGIAGGTPAEIAGTNYYTEGLEDYGWIENCTNNAKIKIQSDDLSNSKANSINAHNIGGVIGYLQGSMKNCKSVKDTVMYIAPMVNYAGSTFHIGRAAVGGVAGYVMKSAINCENASVIKATGLFGACDKKALLAGCGSFWKESVFGGVAGYIGANDGSSEITSCTNSGKFEINIGQAVTDTNVPYAAIGGITGMAKATLNNCENTGTFDIKSNVHFNYVGGIAGLSTYAVNSCSNKAAIDFDNVVTAESTTDGKDKTAWSFYIGGVCGIHAPASYTTAIDKCSNSGKLTAKNGIGLRHSDSSNPSKTSTQIQYVGGIAGVSTGQITGTTSDPTVNSGDIDFFSRRGYVGGVAGEAAASILHANNSGNINAPGVGNEGVTASSMLGGVAGTVFATFSIQLDNETAAKGHGQGDKKGIELICSNSGNVTGIQASGSQSGFGLLSGKINSNGDADGNTVWSGSTLTGKLSVTGGKDFAKVGFISAGGIGCAKVICGTSEAKCQVGNVYYNGTKINTKGDFAAKLGFASTSADLTYTDFE